jgi:hypothetical protein
MIKEQYIENKQKAMLADDLSDYIKDKHTQEKCIGFIDGYNAALAKVKSLGIAFVIERFSLMQKVMWEGLQYWVIEDKGESKVLVANSDNENATDYNDWWVEREKLNAL